MLISDKSKLADGMVGVGFSHPTVALYNGNGDPGTHTNGRRLARGVSVSMNVTTAEGNKFYANDVVAESNEDKFSSGNANLVVDGLLPDSERFINGLPEEEKVTVGDREIPLTRTGRAASSPHVGFGFIRVYESNAIQIFVPIILPKVKFRQAGFDAETQTERKNYQTQNLTADIMRTDGDASDWRWLGAMYTTRDEALADLDALLAVPKEG